MERIYSAFFRPREPWASDDAGLTAAALARHNSETQAQGAGPSPASTVSRTASKKDGGGDGNNGDDKEDEETDADARRFARQRGEDLRQLAVDYASARRDLASALRAAVRAFVYAYGAKAFTAVLLASRKWSSLEYGYADAARLLLRADTIRFGAFFGALVGAFRATELAARAARGGVRDGANLALAGGVAGLALLVDSPARRSTIALYMFVRMLDVVARHLVAIGALPAWEHSSESLFALSNVAIMYAFIVDPSLLPKGYYQWICKIGGVTHHGLEFTVRQRLRGERDVAGHPIAFRPCQPHYHMQVPVESCVTHAIKEWINGLGRSLQIYVPVHMLPALFFRFQQLKSSPVALTAKISLAALCSSAFLTSYQTLVKLVVCTFRNMFHRDFVLTSFLAGLSTGVSLLLEHPKRRFELMLYCAPRAMDIVWRALERRGLVRYVRHSEVALFCLSLALIMSSPPEHFKPTYLRILRFIFGRQII